MPANQHETEGEFTDLLAEWMDNYYVRIPIIPLLQRQQQQAAKRQ